MAAKYHHGNLRKVLIDQGVKLVEESGVNALTLREIADRVGVSRTAPYRHFAEKADLLAAIREAGFAAFAEALEAARDSAADFTARFDAVGLAYLRFAEEHRAYFEVMFGAGCAREEGSDDPVGRRAFDVLEGVIREGQAAGEFRAGDSRMMARVVWAMSHGIAVLRFETDYSASGKGTRFLQAAGRILREGLGA